MADLQVFKNGIGLQQNEILTNMDLSDENSYAADYLYKQLLENFPNAAKSISRKRYVGVGLLVHMMVCRVVGALLSLTVFFLL